MKKWIEIISCAAAVCCIAACQLTEEPISPEQTSLTATTESGSPETRTVLAPAGTGLSQVLWSENDQLDVFMDGGSSPVLFTLVSGAGNKTATFHGVGEANRYIAFYPHSMTPSLGSGETVRFTLPATQNYVEGTFASGSFPMTAVASSADLQFHNVCSVLRLSMTGHNIVTRIVLRTNDPTIKVRGKASVSLSDPSDPVLQLSSDACDSLVLSVPGVKLTETEDTHFFLVLPPQKYKGGLSVRIYSNERYMDKVLKSDFTMKRSHLHKADSFVFAPNGFDNSTYLEGSGTEEDPFRIDSIGDLILMRDAVNTEDGVILSSSGNEVPAATACYLMTDDIDLGEVCSKKSGKSWTPIGALGNNSNTLSFRGRFDGGYHTISGLYINNSSSNQGLFGHLYDGQVRNLTVDGIVSSGTYVGIIAGRSYCRGYKVSFLNCHAKGSAQGGNYLGGIVGYDDNSYISYCVNEAVITSKYGRVGGIAGYCAFAVISDCLNAGSITGQHDEIGGIAGYLNGARVFNCSNTGDVKTTTSYGKYVGGISGYIWQGAKILNSRNTGTVSASGNYSGGICGLVSSDATLYCGPGLVANCYNAGKVSGVGDYVGALAGYVGLPENMTPSESEPVTAAWVKDSYWISDGDAGMETAVGGGPGIVENNHSLTEKQMKGSAVFSGVLYKMADGSSYSKLIDALNAGASEWGDKAMALPASLGGYNPSIELNGWEYASSGSYPSLTDLRAVKPGSGAAEFSLSASSFAFNALDYEFEVDVTSSLSYSLGSLPSWIRQTKIVSYDNRPHLKTHCFTVAVNPDTGSRSAEIVFTNEAGTSLKVLVEQVGVYLETPVTEISFDCESNSKRLSIKSSTRWTIGSDSGWCTVTPQSGSGDGLASINVEENQGDRARTAMVTLSTLDGAIVRKLSVLQSAHTSGDSGDWTKDPFVHKSLVMRLTGTWCGWCPLMNKSVKRAMELYPGKISYMALHSGGGDLDFSNPYPLQNLFNIYSYPTGIVDGRILVSNQDVEITAPNIVNAVKETEDKYGTLTGIEINSSVSGRTAQVDVGVYVKKAGEYKITVFLLEDGIVNKQADYIDGDQPNYVHDNVIRVAMTDVLGEAFTIAGDNTVKDFSFTATVPSSFVMANMHVLVYIQRKFGSYPVIQSGSYGDYFVDNSAEVALGERHKLALEGGGSGGGNGGDNEGIVPGDDINM